MISTNAFDYVSLLGKGADASWKRETVILNNIANADTPTYKRKDVHFSDMLEDEMTRLKYGGSVRQAVHGAANTPITGLSYTDYGDFSYRIDENNVDIDTENVELASEQIKYQILTQEISHEFQRFSTAIGS